jgi:hypothetical protein
VRAPKAAAAAAALAEAIKSSPTFPLECNTSSIYNALPVRPPCAPLNSLSLSLPLTRSASNAGPFLPLPFHLRLLFTFMCDTSCGGSGGIVDIGHINLNIGSADAQAAALAFYVQALGLTRDPEEMTGSANMWINVGSSQFHLPSRPPTQRHRGAVGLVLPCSREALLQRLQRAGAALKGTHFDFDEAEDHVSVCCPFGNRMRLHPPSSHLLGAVALGMAYVEFTAAAGTTPHIARFYTTVLGAHEQLGGSDSSALHSSAPAAAGPSLRVLCGGIRR